MKTRAVTGVKRAILAATNYEGTANQLHGCINDAKIRYKLLIDKLGFDPKNITILLGTDATKANVMAAMARCKAAAKMEDYLYMLWSGHGSQIPSKSKTEKDKLDEIICLDGFSWSPDTMLTDKEFDKFLTGLPGFFFFTPDSCHSDDMMRDITFNEVPKFIPNPELDMTDHSRDVTASSLTKAASPDRCVEISGCGTSQTSADTVIKGVPCGAFSACFNQALEEYGYRATYAQLTARTQVLLKRGKYTQVPVLDCSAALSKVRAFGL